MAIVRYERKPGDPLTRRQNENLKRIAEIKDEDIDFSDIPELTDEWFARAVRGKFYKPIKEIVVDTSVISRRSSRMSRHSSKNHFDIPAVYHFPVQMNAVPINVPPIPTSSES